MFDWLFKKKKKFTDLTIKSPCDEMSVFIPRTCSNCNKCSKHARSNAKYTEYRYRCEFLGLPVKDSDTCKFHKFSPEAIKEYNRVKLTLK